MDKTENILEVNLYIAWCYKMLEWIYIHTYVIVCMYIARYSCYFIIIIITSNDDIQPSTLITDKSPSGLLLEIEAQEYNS